LLFVNGGLLLTIFINFHIKVKVEENVYQWRKIGLPKTDEILKIRMRRLGQVLELYDLSRRKKGVQPFVVGLIGSSSLIEEIRRDLSPKYSVKWGQIISGDNISKEVDVIIFEGKPFYEWENIGYALIPQEQVKAVIEVKTNFCKENMNNYKILIDELKQFFSPQHSFPIYLFFFYNTIENQQTIDAKIKQLKGFGYEDVFILKYVEENVVKDTANKNKERYFIDHWIRFINTIKTL